MSQILHARMSLPGKCLFDEVERMRLILVPVLVPPCLRSWKLFGEPREAGFGCALDLQDLVIRRCLLRPPTKRSRSSDGLRSFQSTGLSQLLSRGSSRIVNLCAGSARRYVEPLNDDVS